MLVSFRNAYRITELLYNAPILKCLLQHEHNHAQGRGTDKSISAFPFGPMMSKALANSAVCKYRIGILQKMCARPNQNLQAASIPRVAVTKYAYQRAIHTLTWMTMTYELRQTSSHFPRKCPSTRRLLRCLPTRDPFESLRLLPARIDRTSHLLNLSIGKLFRSDSRETPHPLKIRETVPI